VSSSVLSPEDRVSASNAAIIPLRIDVVLSSPLLAGNRRLGTSHLLAHFYGFTAVADPLLFSPTLGCSLSIGAHVDQPTRGHPAKKRRAR
jgi:hypothetical protein